MIENKFEKIIDVYNEVDYPKLNHVSIKVFDLEKFVREAKKQNMENVFKLSKKLNEGKKNMDDLLKKMHDEMEELDAQEKMYNIEQREEKVESEIAKFKIDDETK